MEESTVSGITGISRASDAAITGEAVPEYSAEASVLAKVQSMLGCNADEVRRCDYTILLQ